MKILKIVLKNIKNFKGEKAFNIDTPCNVNVISGRNGSGKTTLFKCLHLCQKIYFNEKLPENNNYTHEIEIELSRIFNDNSSYIKLIFSIEEQEFDFSITCRNYSTDGVQYNLIISIDANLQLKKFWNFDEPKNLIVYIPSDKHFREIDIEHNNISITTKKELEQLVKDSIFSPESLFENIYRVLMQDYISERLVPSKPRKDLYYLVTKTMLKKLLPQIEIANFSGQYLDNQFVLLGKSGLGRGNVSHYDIRNFSSGEKVLFNLILFINYVRQIGILIIDEPENHFHEDLLVKVVAFLDDVANAENYSDFIKSIEDNIDPPTATEKRDRYDTYFKNFNINKIYLLSHSKNLIYHNFSIGTNYYLDEDLLEIGFENYEKVLRDIGVSSIYSKVLFVEGTMEENYLELFFSDYGIKVKSLDSQHNVIETFKKVSSIRNYIRDTHFFFLIDRDTLQDDEINKIRETNPTQFDEQFMVLDRHEFENYLLEPVIYKKIHEKHKAIYSDLTEMSIEDINSEIQQIVDSTKELLIKKELNKLNHNSISKIKEIFIKKSVPVLSQEAFSEFIESRMAEKDLNEFIRWEFRNNYAITLDRFNDDIWENEKINLCDGKAVLGILTSRMSERLSITAARLKSEIKQEVLDNKSLMINNIIQEILIKFG